MNWEQHIIANRALSFSTVSIKFLDVFEKSCENRNAFDKKINPHQTYIVSNSLSSEDLNHGKVMTTNCNIIIITTDNTDVDTEPNTWPDNSSKLMKKVMYGIEGDENQENY